MHICFAIPEFLPHPGGIATYYKNLAELLGNAGHRVTILLAEEKPSTLDSPNVSIVNLLEDFNHTLARISVLYPDSWSTARLSLAKALTMRDWLKAHAASDSIDVIGVADFLGFGSVLLEQGLPPLVVTCHGSYAQIASHSQGTHQPEELDFIKTLEATALLRADALNAYSPLNQTFWEKTLQRTVAMTRTPWVLSKSDTPNPLSPNAPTKALVVGRLQDWKGAEVLAQALAHLTETHPQLDLQIEWVGNDTQSGPNNSWMSKHLAKAYPSVFGKTLNWQKAIPREAVIEKQKEAAFIIVPSTWDTFNFTALEALEKGKAVILSDAVGASYLIDHGKNGFLFKSKDSPALASCIAELAQDQSKQATVGKAAKAIIQDTFSSEKILEDHLPLFQAAIDNRKLNQAHLALLGPALSSLIEAPFTPQGFIENLNKLPAKNLIRSLKDKIAKRL